MLEISVEGGSINFKPGERIAGRVSVSQSGATEEVTLHLLFFTHGRGSTHSEIIDSTSWKAPGSSGSLSFSFRLPISPYSFSGKLISVSYRLEATAGNEEASYDLFVSPTGKEIILGALQDDDSEDESISDQ